MGGVPGHEAAREDTACVSQAPGEEETEHERDQQKAGQSVGELIELCRPNELGQEERKGAEKERLPAPGRRPYRDSPSMQEETLRYFAQSA